MKKLLLLIFIATSLFAGMPNRFGNTTLPGDYTFTDSTTLNKLTVQGKAAFEDTINTKYARFDELKTLSRKPRALVTFIFDDGNSTDYTVMKPLFAAKGVPAVSSIVTSLIGTGGYLTWAQVVELYNAGWEMASHTVTHTRLTLISLDSIRKELSVSKNLLRSYGLPTNNFVYPFNSSADSVRRVVREYYRAAAGYVGTEGVNLQMFETHRINRVNIDNDADSLIFKAHIDHADSLKRWLILYGHVMSSVDSAHVAYLIDYIQGKSIPIVTIDQALDSIGVIIEVGDNVAIGETGIRANYIEGNVEFGGNIVGKKIKINRPSTVTTTDTCLSVYWADTNANKIYRPAMVIRADTTKSSPTNTQVTVIQIVGNAINDANDRIISTSNAEWRGDGTISSPLGLFTEIQAANVDVTSILKASAIRPRVDADFSLYQMYNKDFIARWLAGMKGDFIFRDGNFPGNANTNFIQVQDSAGAIKAQIGNDGQTLFRYVLGYPGTADTILIAAVKFAAAKGMVYCDTTGGDTIKAYLNGAWVVK